MSYFPNDERVLVSADQGGNELNHIYVRERDGALRDLTPGENLKVEFLAWRRDGGGFWVTSNERDPQVFDVYEYDAASYERRLVFQNPGMLISDISRDGRWLAMIRPRTSADSDIFLVDLSQAGAREPRLITEHMGNINYGVHEFTPDGAGLLYSTDEHGEYNQAWRYDLTSGAKTPLIEVEWDVMFVFHSPSGRYRVSAVNADASTELTIFDGVGERAVRLSGVLQVESDELVAAVRANDVPVEY